MPTTIKMPQLGETVTEGTVAQWLKKPGDHIEKYEAFVEVSTDKVNAEVPAPVSGVLREIIVSEGQTVPTGAPIAVIEEVGAAAESGGGYPEPVAEHVLSAPTPLRSSAPASTPAASPPRQPQQLPRTNGIGVSPAVRKLAREHNVDLARVHGTGANGRITAQDIMNAARTPGPSAAPAASSSAPRIDGKSTYTQPVPGTTIPLSQARKIIAQRMVESRRTAPHAVLKIFCRAMRHPTKPYGAV